MYKKSESIFGNIFCLKCLFDLLIADNASANEKVTTAIHYYTTSSLSLFSYNLEYHK